MSPNDDPLISQATHNSDTVDVKDSGSHPLTNAELSKRDADPTSIKQVNPIEAKQDEVFDKAGHDAAQSGAGVGSHPKF